MPAAKTYGMFQSAPWKDTAGKIVLIEQGKENTAAEERTWESLGYFYIGNLRTTVSKTDIERGLGYEAWSETKELRKKINRIRTLIDKCQK